MAIPHLDKRIITSNKGGFQLGRRVRVNDQIFPSISQAGKTFNITPRTVRKRVNSPNFADWQWSV